MLSRVESRDTEGDGSACEITKIALGDLEELAGSQSLLYAMELNEYCRTLCNSNDSTLNSEAVKLSKKAVELYKSLNLTYSYYYLLRSL